MKKIIIPIGTLLFSSIAYAQLSPTENYIYSKTYLDYNGVTATKSTETVQYFDGLGRPKQTVNIKTSPLGKDVVTPILYDEYGRKTRDYLPVPQQSTNSGAIYPQTSGNFPVGDPTSAYTNEKAFSEEILERSPLDRILQQKQVGIAWNDKPIQFGYSTNTIGDAVKKYTTVTNWENAATISTVSQTINYGAAQLYKNTVTDEDGNVTIEFKDGEGQILLERKVISATENADTYYVYNEFNQLAFVIPPKAAVVLDPNSVLSDLCYQYRYDSWNRLVEKKVPGKDWEYMVYDKADRLVLTQDANLRAKGQWMFTKYDQFSRPIYTGILDSPPGRTQQVAAIEGHGSNSETRSVNSWSNSGTDVFYTNNSAYPTTNFKVLSVNYYDTYPSYSFNPPFPSIIQGAETLKETVSSEGKSTKGLPVMSLMKNLEDKGWTKNYTYYDTKGRTIGTYSINHLGGYTKTESQLDFTGNPLATYTFHKRKSDEVGIDVKERFVYDSQNRLKQHYHQVDSNVEELLTDNTYNELSQLVNKKVGNNLQSIDYAYNIRGWMTDINKNQMGLTDLGGKLFSYKMKYNQVEGVTNPDPALFAGKNVVSRYNGNIAEADWRSVEVLGVYPSLAPKRYGYAYDSLNRLTAGYYQNPLNTYSKENTESLAYDLNGNITSLYRTSVMENGSTIATKIDDLEYTYKGNQATKIKDNSGNSTGYEGTAGYPISYDANGNMTSMPDKQIFEIKYNELNLPDFLSLNIGNPGTEINTVYRADGTKLGKISVNTLAGYNTITTTTESTDYLDGFQYFKRDIVTSGGGGGPDIELLTARAFEPQAFSLIDPIEPGIDPPFGGGGLIVGLKTPDLQFFPTPEGFYDYQKNQYIYQYKDHLGNVRVSFGKNSGGALEIVDNNDYYPFGMNHLKTGSAYFGQDSFKKYKYNGKELQETGMYDYGTRMYMPDLGKWGVVDPKGAEFPAWSPYNYSLSNPIRFVDPDGMAPNDIVFINNRGVEVHRIKSDTQFKTYIQESINASNNPAQSTAGWKSVPMPNIIQSKGGEDVSGTSYQKNDYQIAARTAYFNQAKNSGQLKLVTEGGNPIPQDAVKRIPDLDPTLVKAMTIQESNAGVKGETDIMQTNVKGDWQGGEMKSQYSLKYGEGASITNSLFAGIRILATKGFKGGIDYNSSTGKTTFKFKGWLNAAGAYNSTAGTKGYQQNVQTMYENSKKPKPQDY